MQMFFFSDQSKDLLYLTFPLKLFIHISLSVARICSLEICLQLRYAWAEILSLQSDVRYVTLHVTEMARIFMHSGDFPLMAGGSSLSNLNYANHFWRPSYTNKDLSAQHCHVSWTCNCETKWKHLKKKNASWHFFFSISFFRPLFRRLGGFISSAADVTAPGLLSCSGYLVYNASCGVAHILHALSLFDYIFDASKIYTHVHIYSGSKNLLTPVKMAGFCKVWYETKINLKLRCKIVRIF